MNGMDFNIDPAHANFDIFGQVITQDVWKDKYRSKNEHHPYDSMLRVSKAIMGIEAEKARDYWINSSLNAMCTGLWMPGGRIQAGAGTDRAVTLHNCYVNGTLHDSMEGIFLQGVPNAAFTLKQGGGIGTDFTPLRPKRARLKTLGEGAMSSGAPSFMDVWDAMCGTIMSAGYRRGAMMGTLACWHPDIEDFIEAKHVKGRWTNFNVSILVTDSFMQAVRDGADWDLWHYEPPAGQDYKTIQIPGERDRYVYKTVPARELWEKILLSTWQYSEPGVIFIDRVNALNNLSYCEDIQCTNPCGEQPLPPHGACDLGAINLARIVKKPFTSEASVDYNLLRKLTCLGVRFLDNVIDVSKYPLEAQHDEQRNKRRIGLGISGLGSAFIQLGVKYGSNASTHLARNVMATIAHTAYETSIQLAMEKGPFPLFDRGKYLERPFIGKLPEYIRVGIGRNGIRNGVLLTIAPVGTNSLYYGNCSSGLEPVFSLTGKRKIRQPDNTFQPYTYTEYAYGLWKHLYPEREVGDTEFSRNCFVTAKDLSVDDHLNIQAACQEWVDASVSKTINCPKEISFEDFKRVYERAYELGCKGCTTYTPSEVRGSILEADSGATTASAASELSEKSRPAGAARTEVSQAPSQTSRIVSLPGEPEVRDWNDGEFQVNVIWAATHPTKLAERPGVMQGKTYKIKWPSRDGALYVTINNLDGRPYEIFINSRSAENAEWMTALTRMISSVMRQTQDIKFIPEELQQVASAHDSNWVNGRFYTSLVSYLGYVIECHIEGKDPNEKRASHNSDRAETAGLEAPTKANPNFSTGLELDVEGFLGKGYEKCPKCHVSALSHQEGCDKCLYCGYSTCG